MTKENTNQNSKCFTNNTRQHASFFGFGHLIIVRTYQSRLGAGLRIALGHIKEKTVDNTFIECSFCESKVLKKNYERHIKKQHSAQAEKKKLDERRRIEKDRLLRQEAQNEYVLCHLCDKPVMRKNLNKHYRKKHDISSAPKSIVNCKHCGKRMPEEELDMHLRNEHKIFNASYPDATMSHLTSAQKKRRIDCMYGPEREESEDAFDRGKISYGGAWGLGKNRKC